jgi:S1-C subfamily serine protease
MKLPAGQEWLSMHAGIFCFGGAKQTWNGGQQEQKVGPYMDVLRPQMQGAGFKVDGDPDNVFEQTASTADLQLAAVINDFYLDVCLPMVGYGNSSTIKGSANMRVQWQLYSTIQKTVVARIDTVGEAHFKDATQGGVAALTMAAFKDNVNSLAASATFRTALAGAPNGGGQTAKPTAQAVIPLLGALTAKSRPVSDTVGAVVLIFAGEAQGSGFLVSADGLMMTDHHVVGDAKYVKVRWPDGIETLGEVIRSDKVRDVALIKTDPRGRQPIRVRAAPLQPGDTVFAIGAPLDPKFQSTVTRGVVSAYRTFEGLSYIQSDVSVNPGSSGGPLLDDSGEVIGMTESGFHVAGAPSGINLFIPISDALDFVNASPK